jgi:hypothetical protein
MALKKALRTSVRRAPDRARFALTFFVFLAFAFQSYVAQTHIHFPHEAAANVFATADRDAAAVKTTTKTGNPDKYPPNGDPANCPICQEILHSGQFVMPDFVALLLPSQSISVVPVTIALPVVGHALSHDWRGRAPPRL